MPIITFQALLCAAICRKKVKSPCIDQAQFNHTSVKGIYPIYAGKSSAKMFRTIWDENLMNIQEQVYVIFLDHQNYPIAWKCLFTGSGNHCNIDTTLLFGLSMQLLARSIVIAHNHPCGVIHPSKHDLTITKNIIKQCGILNIGFIDHVILTDKEYYSFMESDALQMQTTLK